MNQFPDMSWGSRPKGQVVPRVDILGETLFGFQDLVQDLVELPLLKTGIDNEILKFFIPGCSVLFKGILQFSL
jgi:hypothetical protein